MRLIDFVIGAGVVFMVGAGMFEALTVGMTRIYYGAAVMGLVSLAMLLRGLEKKGKA